MTIAFGRQVCGDLGAAAAREWLLADGVGGYAMGTVAGLRTRRYHALLVVPVDGVAARRVGLASLDAVVVAGDRRHRLSTHEWASGVVDPAGHEQLVSFELVDGLPRWRWQLGDAIVERELAMTYGRTGVAVVHRLVAGGGPVRLELTPLCTWRDAHGERFAGGPPSVDHLGDGPVFEGAYRVRGPGWTPGGEWYAGVRLRAEAERGLGDREDVWAAGSFGAELAPGDAVSVEAWAAPLDDGPPPGVDVVAAARARATRLLDAAEPVDDLQAQLVLAADQFVVTTPSGPTSAAGYPWFGEWSRDSMTSYEGLFLATGRHEEGRASLLRAGATVSKGMLANTADTGTLEYNTADGSLWFVHAIDRHVAATGDDDLAAALAPAVSEILEHHQSGTRYGIGVDPGDGLLRQGAEGFALTWMDARIDGRPVTARSGKPVEIQALWINALAVGARLPGVTATDVDRWDGLAATARASFARRFPRADGPGLVDVVDGPWGDDGALRPNGLLACSLPHGPGADRTHVEACRARLLTSLGLRSLDPADPAYRPRHRGGPAERDAAYHQGTVWPWLIGPYVDAARSCGVDVAGVLDGLELHLAEWGLGSVSETTDGDAPHAATGCPFQAWSVAELLRVRPTVVEAGAGGERRAREARTATLPA